MPGVPPECGFLIQAASLLVPRSAREHWRRRWESRVWGQSANLERTTDTRFAIRRRLLLEAVRSLPDAAAQRFGSDELRGNTGRITRHPRFAFGVAAVLLLFIGIASRGFEVTRSMLGGPEFHEPERVVFVGRRSHFYGMRSPLLWPYLNAWTVTSSTVSGVGCYTYRGDLGAVTPGFFALLGVQPVIGRSLAAEDLERCSNCALLSHAAWNGDPTVIGRTMRIGRRDLRIVGVLPREFWFLARRIKAWTLYDASRRRSEGTIARMRPGATPGQVERELAQVSSRFGLQPVEGAIKATTVLERTRAPLRVMAFVILISMLLAAVLDFRRPAPMYSSRSWGHLLAKSAVIILVLSIATMEFTGIASMTMQGTADFTREPLGVWALLVACTIGLRWSASDQRKRCPLCLRILAQPARIGAPDRMLLETGGTELVCEAGHGMLYVPAEMTQWRDPVRWIELDESWRDLFSTKSK